MGFWQLPLLWATPAIILANWQKKTMPRGMHYLRSVAVCAGFETHRFIPVIFFSDTDAIASEVTPKDMNELFMLI